MKNYFYFDQHNNKRGPFDVEQIKQLARYKHISPTTPLETDDGDKMLVGDIISDLVNSQSTATQTSGFFDIRFTRFITNTWISIIWVIVIIAHFIAPFVVCAVMANTVGGGAPIVAFVLSVPLALLSLLFSRMSLELTIVLFRIESNTRATKERLEELKV